jgi:dUTP pyrophosphatase
MIMRVIVAYLHKLHPDVPIPAYQTTDSACFDLAYFPREGETIVAYNSINEKIDGLIPTLTDHTLYVGVGTRVLVPTGLVMKINELDSYSIRLHARSGLALKHGIVLANAEGIIDKDYQQEIFVMLHNISKIPYRLDRGTRICQAEIVSNYIADFIEIKEMPEPMSERDGGFGSTGN